MNVAGDKVTRYKIQKRRNSSMYTSREIMNNIRLKATQNTQTHSIVNPGKKIKTAAAE